MIEITVITEQELKHSKCWKRFSLSSCLFLNSNYMKFIQILGIVKKSEMSSKSLTNYSNVSGLSIANKFPILERFNLQQTVFDNSRFRHCVYVFSGGSRISQRGKTTRKGDTLIYYLTKISRGLHPKFIF